MRKYLISRGNGWGISTTREIIGLLCIDPKNSYVQFKITNKTLYVKEISENDPKFNKCLIKKLSKLNSSWYLYLPISVIELLGINPEVDKIDIEINNNILMVKKA